MSKDIFQPSVRIRSAPARGRTSSVDYNAFQSESVRDASSIATALNNLNARFEKRVTALEAELATANAKADRLAQHVTDDNLRAALLGNDLTYTNDLTSTAGLLFTNVSEARRLRIRPQFGQATVPFNQKVSRLYSLAPTTRDVFIPSNLQVSVAAVSEGSGATIYADNPALAVDGRVGEGFIRKVAHPGASDVEAVTMDVNIEVPSLFATDANFLTILPTPAGQVDITNVWYSTTTAAATTALPGFSAVHNTHGIELHFAPLAITKLRIRLQQRHWYDDATEKVFAYGLKEVSLDLVELDKTNSGAGWQSTDNLAIYKVDAPSGFTFDTIKSFTSTPTYATGASDNGIYFGVFAEEALSTNLWDSFTDPAIAYASSGSHVDISASTLSSIYVAVNLAYDTPNEVSPVLAAFQMAYSVQ